MLSIHYLSKSTFATEKIHNIKYYELSSISRQSVIFIMGRDVGFEPTHARATIWCVNPFTNSAIKHIYCNKWLLEFQVYCIMFEEVIKMLLSVTNDFMSIINSIKHFFINIWQSIQGFFLRYVSEQTFNIILLALIVVIVLCVLLAIINRN